MERTGNGSATFSTVRLALSDKLALIAGMIFALGPEGITPEAAMKYAEEISDRGDVRSRELKKEAAAA